MTVANYIAIFNDIKFSSPLNNHCMSVCCFEISWWE